MIPSDICGQAEDGLVHRRPRLQNDSYAQGPVASLPDETLAPILCKAIWVEASADHTFECWQRRVVLTTVCKTWRGIALDSPAFWAGFHLFPAYKGLKEMLPRWKQHSRAIFIYLDRVGGRRHNT